MENYRTAMENSLNNDGNLWTTIQEQLWKPMENIGKRQTNLRMTVAYLDDLPMKHCDFPSQTLKSPE